MADKTPNLGQLDAAKQVAEKAAADRTASFGARTLEQIKRAGIRAVQGYVEGISGNATTTGDSVFGSSFSYGHSLSGTSGVDDITKVSSRAQIQAIPRQDRISNITLRFGRIRTGLGMEVDRVLQRSQDEVVTAITQTWDVMKSRIYGLQKTVTILDKNIKIVDIRTKQFQGEISQELNTLQRAIAQLQKKPADDKLLTTGLGPEKKEVTKVAGDAGFDWGTALKGFLAGKIGLGLIGAAISKALLIAIPAAIAAHLVGAGKYTGMDYEKYKKILEEQGKTRREGGYIGENEIGGADPETFRNIRDWVNKRKKEGWNMSDLAKAFGLVMPGVGLAGKGIGVLSDWFVGEAKADEVTTTNKSPATETVQPEKSETEQTDINLTAKETILLRATKSVSIHAPQITIEAADIIFKGRVHGLPGQRGFESGGSFGDYLKDRIDGGIGQSVRERTGAGATGSWGPEGGVSGSDATRTGSTGSWGPGRTSSGAGPSAEVPVVHLSPEQQAAQKKLIETGTLSETEAKTLWGNNIPKEVMKSVVPGSEGKKFEYKANVEKLSKEDITKRIQTGTVNNDARGDAASKEAMKFFLSKGYSKAEASGIVANLSVESDNFAADVISGKRRGDGGQGWGIAQWHPDRQKRFENWAKHGTEGATLQEQLEFVDYEFKNHEQPAFSKFKAAADNPQDKAAAFDKHYERSSGEHRGRRQQIASGLMGSEYGVDTPLKPWEKITPEREAQVQKEYEKQERTRIASAGVIPTGEGAPVQGESFSVHRQSREQLSSELRKSDVGSRIVSLDFNSSASGNVKGGLLVIPNNATAEERKAAESYATGLKKYFEDRGYPNYKVDIKTTAENTRGKQGFFHTEPFFHQDADAVAIVQKDPAGYAAVLSGSLGKLPGTKFIPPHEEKDQGAVSDTLGSERAFALSSIIPELEKTAAALPASTVASATPGTEADVTKATPSDASKVPIGSIAEARAYLLETATPGGTMTQQGAATAIERLHPDMALKLARAVKKARDAGMKDVGIFSAYRSPSMGANPAFASRSTHAVGGGVDMTGIGRPGSKQSKEWYDIATSEGLHNPYGASHGAEWNHYQLTAEKSAQIHVPHGPQDDMSQMWASLGVPLPQEETEVTQAAASPVNLSTGAISPKIDWTTPTEVTKAAAPVEDTKEKTSSWELPSLISKAKAATVEPEVIVPVSKRPEILPEKFTATPEPTSLKEMSRMATPAPAKKDTVEDVAPQSVVRIPEKPAGTPLNEKERTALTPGTIEKGPLQQTPTVIPGQKKGDTFSSQPSKDSTGYQPKAKTTSSSSHASNEQSSGPGNRGTEGGGGGSSPDRCHFCDA